MGSMSERPEMFDNQKKQVTVRERRILSSPLKLILLLTASVFVIELVAMSIISLLPRLPLVVETFLDSLLLSVFLFPILYLYVFRPMLHLVADYRLSEQNLLAARDLLEQKVAERTEELNKALLNLQTENAERCLAEFALGESEDRLRQIFEQSEDAIVLFDAERDVILDLNPVTENLFGKGRAQLLAGGVRCLGSGDEMERLVMVVEEIRKGSSSADVERFDLQIGNGERRIFSFRGKRIFVQGSTVLYTTFRDITRRVRLEEESREIQARLIHANRMTSLGLLVASVAHEINNPNNYILMNASLLQQSWKDIHAVLRERYLLEGDFMVGRTTFSEAARFLPDVYDGIVDGARRISEIVDSLKDYGRDDRDDLQSLVDLNAVVRLSVSIMNHHISRTTKHFSLELDDALPPVRGRRRQLEQVVVNLIGNALQSLSDTDHGVRVSTRLAVDGEHVLLRIEDQGRGIPREIASRVMEPFFTTRLDRGGTGLGLAICGTIISDHQGSIHFESEPDTGTVFTVSLRCAEVSDNQLLETEASSAK